MYIDRVKRQRFFCQPQFDKKPRIHSFLDLVSGIFLANFYQCFNVHQKKKKSCNCLTRVSRWRGTKIPVIEHLSFSFAFYRVDFVCTYVYLKSKDYHSDMNFMIEKAIYYRIILSHKFRLNCLFFLSIKWEFLVWCPSSGCVFFLAHRPRLRTQVQRV